MNIFVSFCYRGRKKLFGLGRLEFSSITIQDFNPPTDRDAVVELYKFINNYMSNELGKNNDGVSIISWQVLNPEHVFGLEGAEEHG